ncbi:hypothetical protein FOMPIDRAFT_1056208 [Fomitopsis schrenkii]|uniref:F-box domain-containing protein n=1 Tax=Fomitopsis schrenkii TaxID=2126942 RepID=S8DPU0_FOMSC|nr:hypothetical protein FOMPIDRAFT_1056208 [Fomitopsis schrenkii]
MQDALSESLDTALESLSLQPRIFDHELLPPEVWVVVIEHCTRASQRACLSLSRAFHRRALPLLFREIVVSFGAWESWVAEEQLDTTADIRHLQQLDEARSSRAYDILRRITLDPSFAGAIRSLEIEAYMRDGSRGVTEKCCLNEAIQHLPNLESFFWNGCTPSPSLEMLDALAESCPRLQDLALPILSYVTLPFWKLRGLRWIAFNWTIEDILDPLLDEYEDAKLDEDTFPDMRELHFFFTSPATVRSLGSYLNRITHLNLLFIRDLENLDDLLRNLPYVESLTLQTLRENQEGQLLAAFEHGPFNFPRLTQLKICGEENEDPLLLAGVTALADVARGIPSLQCFDCSFCVESADLEVLSPAILSLKHLTVLGLHVGHLTAEKDTVRNVLRQMPAQLDALALTVSGGQLNEYELAELWTRCQHLRYLYLCAWSEVAVTVQDLAREGKALELVGLKNAFHDVERTGDEVKLSEKWSDRKVEFRGTDDFGCSEWEWLMREKIIW